MKRVERIPHGETGIGGTQPTETLEQQETTLPPDMQAIFDIIDTGSMPDDLDPTERAVLEKRLGLYDQNPLRELIYRRLDATVIERPEQLSAFLTEVAEHYVGKKNKSRWTNLDHLGFVDDGDLVKGDSFLVNAIVYKIANDPRWQAMLSRDTAHSVFVRLFNVFKKRHDVIQKRLMIEHRERKARGEKETIWIDNSGPELTEGDALYGDWGEEIQMINQLLKNLAPCGNRQTIDVVIQAIQSLGSFATGCADRVFSSIDPSYAAQKMLEYLQGQESRQRADHENRRIRNRENKTRDDFARVLRRLEFGKINISEAGVRYLEKLYDLGEYNKVENFVQRLTDDGHIGVFDERRVLKKFFMLGDVAALDSHIEAELHDVTLDMLCAVTEDDSPTENQEKEKILEQFCEHYFEFYDSKFFKETGVHFNNLSLREQTWFMRFARSEGAEDRQAKALALVKQYKEAGLRTFLSVEFDAGAGNKIFTIAERFRGREAEAIFAKYNSVVTAANALDAYASNFFTNPERKESLPMHRVTKEIMTRAGRILTEFAETDDALTKPECLAKLNDVEADIVMFASIFKAAFKGKEHVDFQEVRGLSYETVAGAMLTETDQRAMTAIAAANYPQEPAVAEEVAALFEKGDKLDQNTFYILRKHHELPETEPTVAAFMRVEKRAPDRVYVGSFNVAPELRSAAIGEQFLAQTLAQYRGTHTIEAVAVPELRATTYYIDKLGFVATHFDKEAHGTLHGWFDMAIDKSPIPSTLRGLSTAELKKRCAPELPDPEQITDKEVVVRVNLATGMEALRTFAETLLNKRHYRLTRHLCLNTTCDERLYGFEAPQQIRSDNLTTSPTKTRRVTGETAPHLHA